MEFPKKVIGIEQVDDEQITHKETDYRPIFMALVWTAFTTAALIVSEVTK